MPLSNATGLLPSRLHKSKRNPWSCARCRADKQKCEPEKRDWDNLEQRCDRCIRLNHECGPSERKTQRRTRRRGSTIQDLNGEAASTMLRRPPPQQDPSQFDMNDSREDFSVLSSLLQPTTVSGLHLNSCVHDPLQDSIELGNSPISNRKRFKQDGRLSLKRLEDIQATKRILKQKRQSVLDVQRRLGTSDTVNIIHEFLARLAELATRKWTDRLEEAGLMIEEDMGTAKEIFLTRLKALGGSLEGRTNVPGGSFSVEQFAQVEIKQISANINKAYYQYQRRKEHFSDAEYITNSITDISGPSAPPNLGPECEAYAAYERAALDLERELKFLISEHVPDEIVFVEDSMIHLGLPKTGACPVALLAYCTGHKKLAHRLWQQNPTSLLEVDMLQRNAIHHVVDNGDIHALQHLITYDPDILASEATDIFGFTPIAIAATKGSVNMLSFLLEHGSPHWIRDKDQRGILSLAARAGNEPVVRQILRKNLFSPPMIEALNLAIQGRHETVASLLIEASRGSLIWCDTQALQSIIHQATLQGMDQVVSEIQSIFKARNFGDSQLEVVETLNRLEFQGSEYIRNNSMYGQNISAQDTTLTQRDIVNPGIANSSFWMPAQTIYNSQSSQDLFGWPLPSASSQDNTHDC